MMYLLMGGTRVTLHGCLCDDKWNSTCMALWDASW